MKGLLWATFRCYQRPREQDQDLDWPLQNREPGKAFLFIS